MLNICVHCLTRDGQFLDLTIRAVAPNVKTVIIAIDSRSSDKTFSIVEQLRLEFSNIIVYHTIINDPIDDLVSVRNKMIQMTVEPYIWIVDDDEYYPDWEIKTIKLAKHISYGFRRYSPWTETMCDESTSRSPAMRIFKNLNGVKWEGIWGKEKLMYGEVNFCYEYQILPQRYIHFTHWKKDVWRKEMNHIRKVDGKHLLPMPENIINLIKTICQKNAVCVEEQNLKK